MNSVNGVNNSRVNQINPAEMSQQDFIAAVYLERGEMLDTEVRRLVAEMDKSNHMASAINTLMSKTDVSQYGTETYMHPTWTVNGNTVVLDNGYGLTFSPDGNGGTTFTLLDADGNQLIYQNQTLVPVPKGTTVDVLKAGIPVMNDMTFVLDDGTKINFQAGTPETPFDGQNFSGGLASITQVVITRGNQSLLVSDIDTSIPSIGMPSVDGVAEDNTEQEPVTKPARTLSDYTKVYGGETPNYGGANPNNEIQEYGMYAYQQLAQEIYAMSQQEQEALFDVLKRDGISVKWNSREEFWERRDEWDVMNVGQYDMSQEQTWTVLEGETLLAFLKRTVTESSVHYIHYGNVVSPKTDYYSITRLLESINVEINLPSYTYTPEMKIPSSDEPELVSVAAQQAPWGVQRYARVESTSEVKNQQRDYMQLQMEQMLSGMTDKEKDGLLEELKNNGVTISWDVEGLKRDYKHQPRAGETLGEFMRRMVDDSVENMWHTYNWTRGESNILAVQVSTTFPAYTYDNAVSANSFLSNEIDASFNDGYILTESGGVHDWEYAGGSVSNMTVTNPGSDDETVSGFFARKQAFEADFNNEISVTVPFLTQKEIDLLTKELRITYSDASGTGNLTPEEWASLKSTLVTARDNLTSNTQLQTARLQRAMQAYTQNYDAMSNAQSKIYNLLKDIVANTK